MKQFSADLTSLLASKVPVYRVHLFAIGPCQNGAMLYATDGGEAITFAGNTYQPTQYGNWTRGAITSKIGLDYNSCTLTVLADNYSPVYFPGFEGDCFLLDGLKYGLLDRAPVTVWCAYMVEYGVVTGSTGGSLVEVKFVGEVGPIPKIGFTKAEIEVRDLLYLLNAQTPQMLLQADCRWDVYSPGCTLNAGDFTVTSTVSQVVTILTLTVPTLTPRSALGTFAQGFLTWVSGRNRGLTVHVATWVKGTTMDTIGLDIPPLFPVTLGDQFTITQGCSRTYASCIDLQGAANAQIHYGGTPNVPVPEAAI